MAPANDSGNWLERRSLRAKMIIAFGALIALMLAMGAASLLSHRRALATVEVFLARDNRIAELSLTSSVALMRARRNEKDFLLKVGEYGYDEARSRYLTLVQSALATVRQDVHAIAYLATEAEVQEQTDAIVRVCDQYEAEFVRVAALYGRLGHHNSGLEGAFRVQAHQIEELLDTHGAAPQLKLALLNERRHEKDFIMRGSTTYAAQFDAASAEFDAAVRRASLAAPVRQQLLSLNSVYRTVFHQYVDTAAAIETVSQSYLMALHRLEPMLEQLHAHAGNAAAVTLAELYRQSKETAWTLTIVTAGAILAGAAIAMVIGRGIDRTLRECVDFAGRIAGGNLSARLRAGRHELGVLSDSMNRMADSLQQASNRQLAQELELRRLNRALLVLSQCNETLVRATDEGELLNEICQHMVDVGGYRLAWVGLAANDEDKRIVMAAHAGSDRDYIEALQLSWGEDSRRNGISGAAIRRNEAVVARHIALDPAFALWRADAIKRGFAACTGLPLCARGVVLGSLCIYSERGDTFDLDELKVLRELADDLAFGIVTLRAAAERARFEQELERHATYDTLTGLANRFTLEARLVQSIADARRSGGKVVTMFIDLDRFKVINDTLGHAVGDNVLVEVARRLESTVRESDTVARLGGDEFVVFLTNVETAADAAGVAAKIVAQMDTPMWSGGQDIRPAASIGISIFPDDGADASAVIRSADLAMYDAKSLGGNTYRFYAPEMNARMAARFAMDAELRGALERGELMMYYQPQLSLGDGRVTGAEALIRWSHPQKGMVAPAHFIPLAEETGLIVPIGEWVIDTVCAQIRAWIDAGLTVIPVAVNLSAHQFRQESLVPLVQRALARNSLPPQLLELEITESAVMHNVDTAVATLSQLRALGVGLSLDDFGTGYSSLAYLKRFPIDQLKIDQSFVRDITSDPDDAAICNAVIGLAHNLRMTVIAEGVETEAQMHYLRRHNCDEMQGYFFSRPLPVVEFGELLASGRRLVLPLTSVALA
ncbi:MAG: EAL domain-containing protein [Pseudomonadota bacterium]